MGDPMPSFAQFVASSSHAANKRGIYLGRRSTKMHVALYRWSAGRIGGHLPGWPEARIVLVDHTGAKSGVKTNLSTDVPRVRRCRSGGGLEGRPADASCLVSQSHREPRYHDPDRPVVREVRARVATEEERDRLWPEFVAFYPGYELFQSDAKGRTIPIVIFDPR